MKMLVPSLMGAVALFVLSLGTTAMAGDIESGLQKGEKTKYFAVQDVTGPRKDKKVCYR